MVCNEQIIFGRAPHRDFYKWVALIESLQFKMHFELIKYKIIEDQKQTVLEIWNIIDIPFLLREREVCKITLFTKFYIKDTYNFYGYNSLRSVAMLFSRKFL